MQSDEVIRILNPSSFQFQIYSSPRLGYHLRPITITTLWATNPYTNKDDNWFVLAKTRLFTGRLLAVLSLHASGTPNSHDHWSLVPVSRQGLIRNTCLIVADQILSGTSIGLRVASAPAHCRRPRDNARVSVCAGHRANLIWPCSDPTRVAVPDSENLISPLGLHLRWDLGELRKHEFCCARLHLRSHAGRTEYDHVSFFDSFGLKWEGGSSGVLDRDLPLRWPAASFCDSLRMWKSHW